MPANHPGEVLKALLDASPAGIIALDPDGRVRLWSHAAEVMFGWTSEEVVDQPLPLDLQLQGSEERSVELRVNRRDGATIAVAARIAPWVDSEGRAAGTLAILDDITGRHRMERDFKVLMEQEQAARRQADSERRFRELLEAAPDAIIEVDRDGRIVLLNRVTENMFGYPREQLLGQPVEVLIPESLRPTHHHHRGQYWNQPQTRTMGSGLSLFARRKDGSRFPVEIGLSPVKSDDGFRVTAIIRDISERRQAEDRIHAIQEKYTRELAETNRVLGVRNLEIERANRLKSEFLASMSHELRTPLHTIIGFSELLAEQLEGPLNEKQQRFIQHIHKDSLHLLELINDVLDLSKIEAGKVELRLEAFDVATAVEEVLASIRPLGVSKSLRMETEIAVPQALEADRMRFKQILFNLLSNAVKFTPEGGTVRVEASIRGEFVEISVSDTGIGIPKEELESVFDKFYQVGHTTKGVREGTGLGLAITQTAGGGARRDHHSQKRAFPRQPVHVGFSPDAETGWEGMKTVLVADDKPTGRELVRTVLENPGTP